MPELLFSFILLALYWFYLP